VLGGSEDELNAYNAMSFRGLGEYSKITLLSK